MGRYFSAHGSSVGQGMILSAYSSRPSLISLQAIINFAKERAAAQAAGQPVPNIGRGVGMAIGLFCTTVSASVATHQFFWRSMTTGLLARAALIASIYKRGVNLTGKARTNFPNSALVNHISTDVSRVDACAQWFVSTRAYSYEDTRSDQASIASMLVSIN